jgi:hypothetical protein
MMMGGGCTVCIFNLRRNMFSSGEQIRCFSVKTGSGTDVVLESIYVWDWLGHLLWLFCDSLDWTSHREG